MRKTKKNKIIKKIVPPINIKIIRHVMIVNETNVYRNSNEMDVNNNRQPYSLIHENNPYRKVEYTRLGPEKFETNGLINTKQLSKNKYNRHEPTTTTEIQAHAESGGVSHVGKSSTVSLLWTLV